MTDLPDTDTLKGLLANATPGPWAVSPTDDTTVICPARSVVANIDGDYNEPDLWPIMEANARLIALAPSLAARVIELEAEVANLRDAIHAATDPDFIWGAMDNVFDMDSDLDDLAAAASRAIRAALGDRT